jgi:MFS family permease
MVFLLYPWLSLSVTHSSAAAGLVVTITSIPGLILSPLIGSFIDKFGRRRFAYLTEWMTVLTTIAIPLVALFTEFNLVTLIVIGIIRSMLGFGGPSSRKSLVPDTAERGGISLERANSIHESVAAAGFALGPALASLLLTVMQVYDVFYVVALLCGISGLAAWLIRVVERHEAVDASAAHSFIYYATQGFRTLFKTPAVLIAMTAFVVLAVVYIPTEMIVLPRYFQQVHNPSGLGLLLATMAGATSLGSMLFEWMSKRFSFTALFKMALFGVAIPVVVLSTFPPYWLMLAVGFVLGFAWGPLPPLLNTVIQRKVPANERGRVFSLEMTIWSGGPMISMVAVGVAADTFPLQAVYLTLALLTVLSAVLITSNRRAKELNTAEFSD